jgi:hypothetical protein
MTTRQIKMCFRSKKEQVTSRSSLGSLSQRVATCLGFRERELTVDCIVSPLGLPWPLREKKSMPQCICRVSYFELEQQ